MVSFDPSAAGAMFPVPSFLPLRREETPHVLRGEYICRQQAKWLHGRDVHPTTSPPIVMSGPALRSAVPLHLMFVDES